MTAPNAPRFVPGSRVRPNTRRSDLELEWAADDAGEALWLADSFERDDDVGPRVRNWRKLVDLPPMPTIDSLQALSEALQARWDAHPLANQVPGVEGLAEQAIAAGVDGLDVAREGLRWACPGAIGRGFGAALRTVGAGAYRGGADVQALRRLARACIVIRIAALGCHLREGGPCIDEGTRTLLGPSPWPPFLVGKHPRHDGGDHDEVVGLYETMEATFFRAARPVLEEALAAPTERLDAPVPCRVPEAEYTPQEALAKSVERGSVTVFFWPMHLFYDLRALHGQPLAAVAARLGAMLSGDAPVALEAEHAANFREASASGGAVVAALEALIATDIDLREAMRERAEKAARDEVERAQIREEIARDRDERQKASSRVGAMLRRVWWNLTFGWWFYLPLAVLLLAVLALLTPRCN